MAPATKSLPSTLRKSKKPPTEPTGAVYTSSTRCDHTREHKKTHLVVVDCNTHPFIIHYIILIFLFCFASLVIFVNAYTVHDVVECATPSIIYSAHAKQDDHFYFHVLSRPCLRQASPSPAHPRQAQPRVLSTRGYHRLQSNGSSSLLG